jgi:hypothetical protein
MFEQIDIIRVKLNLLDIIFRDKASDTIALCRFLTTEGNFFLYPEREISGTSLKCVYVIV